MNTNEFEIDNLQKMFKTFTDASMELQKSQEQLKNKVAELTEELEEKNKELRRKERLAAIGEMAASIAHEIRNPLGGIELYTSLIKKKVQDKEFELCGKILNGVSALNKIVEDLLCYAKEYHPEKETFEWKVFTDSLYDYITADCDKKEIKYECVLPSESHYQTDKGMLFQVLLNLLRNAIQACPAQGSVKFSIHQNEDSCYFIVEDSGDGLSDEAKEKLFQPFFTTKSTGSGLGLAIVQRFVEAHNGNISVQDSEELGGACFVISLPHKNN